MAGSPNKPRSGSFRYFLLHKPYGVISQFRDKTEKNRTLWTLFDFPPEVYPVGRLDKDSEGLLLITNDRSINKRLLNPEFGHEREYWSQVQGEPTPERLEELERGVTISLNGAPYFTRPAKAKLIEPQPRISSRQPPISPRGTWPVKWISLTLTEGKNRQVRRMTAGVGLPTLRLIRVRIVGLTLEGMGPGDIRELKKDEVYDRLFGG